VKWKAVLAVAMVGILGLSATGAQAGGAGGVPAAMPFFICNQINGDDAGATVDARDSGLLNNLQSLRLGNATLACALVRLFEPGTNNFLRPNPDGSHESLKCYSVSVAKKPGSVNRLLVTDELTGEEPVQMTGVQFICAPASYNFSTP
jgi:hypothetical protein